MDEHDEDYLDEIRTRTDEQSREDHEVYYDDAWHYAMTAMGEDHEVRLQALEKATTEEDGCPRCIMVWVSDLYELHDGRYGCIVHHGGMRIKMTGRPESV